MQWLAEICVHRPVFATVIILVLTVVGAFSFFTLGVDRFPRIDLPTVSISTSNVGASPQEMENEVTNIVEGAVNTVPGIDTLSSTSSQGSSNVTITFNLEKNPNVAVQEVQSNVSAVINKLPKAASPPVVRKSDPNSTPVVQYAISAPRSVVDLTDLVQTAVVDRLQSADGVGNVLIYGGRQRQINVFINPDRLKAYNLTITQVTNAVSAQNKELPTGTLTEGSKTVSLRTMSSVTNVADFGNLVVANNNGFPVKINDIGYVEDGGADPTSAVSLNSVQSVSVAVIKQSDANTISVINAVKERMTQIAPTLPPDLKIGIVRDQAPFIENSLHAIEEHLIFGGIFAAAVVFLFLWNVRSTIIAALAIPSSIIAAFAMVAIFGYTLNQMTMLALTLMVGIVIDDAIVVLENIYRFVEEKGMNPFQAAIEGTREIGLAVLATTLSLLAVFIPVGFMKGIVGQFMSSFGLTSAAAIAVSLIVSFTLTPMLAARWIKRPTEKEGPNSETEAAHEIHGDGIVQGREASGDEHEAANSGHAAVKTAKERGFYRVIDGTYTWLLNLSMRFRWAVVLICILVVAAIYPLFRFVGMSFIPDEDESNFSVSVTGPQGMSLAAMQSFLDRIARDLHEQLPEVKDTVVLAGAGGRNSSGSGSVNVNLVPPEQRKTSQNDLIQKTRDLIKKYQSKDYRIAVSPVSSIASSLGVGGRGGSAVGFYVSGPDLRSLDTYSNQLLEKIGQDSTFRDATRSLNLGNPEVQIAIDRTRAADLNVDASNIASALNVYAAGQVVSSFSQGTNQYDVVVRAAEKFRRTPESFKNFTVSSSNGTPVQLDQLVDLNESTSPTSIDRINQQRQVTISANLPPNGSQSDAVVRIQDLAKSLNMPPEYSTGVTGQSKELGRATSAFELAFLLSFVFMYLILAAQFESFIHPVTILLTLPLSIPFALASTAIAGQTLNIFSALGILLLFGIVKKNAILQIDHTNQLRAQGMNRNDAIVQANRDRLRPILMTTIALVAGMLPLIWGSGAGAATNRSIGILVVGGQSLCLLLTLLAVPVFYSLFDDAKESSFFGRIGSAFNKLKIGVLRPAYERIAGMFRVRKTEHATNDSAVGDRPDVFAEQSPGK